MSVSDATTVDAIGRDRESGEIVLSIADDLDWAAPAEHLETLLQKVSAYIGFVASGGLTARVPDAAGLPIRIDVVFRHEPPEQTADPLSAMERYVHDAGFSFSRRTLGGESS